MKSKNVGVDLIFKFQDGEDTEYKCHLDVPREDVDRLKKLVNHYITLATNFPALMRAFIAKAG